MTIKKPQLEKLNSAPVSSAEGEPSVLARFRYHESVAKWCDRWLTSVHVFFAMLGFIVVLLPVLIKPWRIIIENTPLVSKIFHDYSSFNGLSMNNLIILMIIFFVKNLVQEKLTNNQIYPISYRTIIVMKMYPKTIKAEMKYWLDFLFAITSATLWLFLPFGVLAFFISLKG